MIVPESYQNEVSVLLDRFPDAQYLHTASTCSSLNPSTTLADGRVVDIYVVYVGPFASQEEACAAASRQPDNYFVRRLDNSDPDTAAVRC